MTLTTLSLVLVLSAAPAEGAPTAERTNTSEAPACDEARSRMLGGHTFLFPILQSSALITTHVGIREGLARYDEDTGTEADYIVVELARHVLGESWLPDYVARANAGGIERVLV